MGTLLVLGLVVLLQRLLPFSVHSRWLGRSYMIHCQPIQALALAVAFYQGASMRACLMSYLALGARGLLADATRREAV